MAAHEHLFRCLKKMECAAQGMLFEIPHEGSEAFLAMMALDDSDSWKLDAMRDYLIWYRDKVTAASNRVYLEERKAELKKFKPRGTLGSDAIPIHDDETDSEDMSGC